MKKEKLLEIVHIILLEKDIHLLKAVLSNTKCFQCITWYYWVIL